jgi:copper chaperone CopZ
MPRLTRRSALLALAGASLTTAAGMTALAQQPVQQPPYTTIVVHDMHCQNCANKIAGKLYKVPGVVEVRADVAKNTAYVVPGQGKALSPAQLWSAVESAGFKVASLSGPNGSFTSKPKL